MGIMFYIRYIGEEGEEMSPSFRKFILRWEIFWFCPFEKSHMQNKAFKIEG